MDSVGVEVSVILAAMALSAAGVVIVRRFVDIGWLERHHQIAGYFVGTIGTLYAVLLAFAVFAVWSDFKQASSNLEQEANQIGDLSRMAKGLSEPLRENVQTALVAYVRSVVEDEFPAMAEDRDSPRTWQTASDLWNVYRAGSPGDDKARFYYEESVKRLIVMGDYRRLRLLASHGTVPEILWWLLCTGAVLLVGFTYLFALPSIRSQMMMTAALGGFLAFTLLLITALDSPFGGAVRVADDPVKIELSHLSAAQSE
jgi:Protein of unknown function (DUF4239)